MKDKLLLTYIGSKVIIYYNMTNPEFANMVAAQKSFLSKLAIKFTRNTVESDDLIQETFFKALTNRRKFKKGTNLKGWLYTIMRNTFINTRRKRKTQSIFSYSTNHEVILSTRNSGSSVSSDSLLDKEFVMNSIASIKKHHLDIFMAYYNGYKYQELSEIYGIPIGTVKSRIFFARKKLKKELASYYLV